MGNLPCTSADSSSTAPLHDNDNVEHAAPSRTAVDNDMVMQLSRAMPLPLGEPLDDGVQLQASRSSQNTGHDNDIVIPNPLQLRLVIIATELVTGHDIVNPLQH